MISARGVAKQERPWLDLKPARAGMSCKLRVCGNLVVRKKLRTLMTLDGKNKEMSRDKSTRHGGQREGAGRPAGVPNKATKEQGARLSELAKSYTNIAFGTLVDVAMNGSSDTARIAAANAILDRGYGKPRVDEIEAVDLPPIVIQRAE